MRIRKAVFPAAGWGTRFLPATKAQPKEMLPLVDKPVIQYAVEEAVAAGIEQVIIVTSSQKRAIEDHFDLSYELEHLLEERGDVEMLRRIRHISDLAQVAYDHVTRGVGSTPVQLRTRYRWLSPRLDYLAYRSLAARGELTAGGWLASLASSRKVYDLFAWNDPLPAFAVLWDELRHFSRLRHRVMRWLSTAS